MSISDDRPENCRHRLQDEGKAYPRSSCSACGKTVTTGLGRACTVNQSAAPTRDISRAAEALADAVLKAAGSRMSFYDPSNREKIIAAAVKGIEAERERNGWQTIESAPKDATNILVWSEGYAWPECIRYELYNDPEIEEEGGEPGFWRFSDDLFADVAEVDISDFTHWMLPMKPEAT